MQVMKEKTATQFLFIMILNATTSASRAPSSQATFVKCTLTPKRNPYSGENMERHQNAKQNFDLEKNITLSTYGEAFSILCKIPCLDTHINKLHSYYHLCSFNWNITALCQSLKLHSGHKWHPTQKQGPSRGLDKKLKSNVKSFSTTLTSTGSLQYFFTFMISLLKNDSLALKKK